MHFIDNQYKVYKVGLFLGHGSGGSTFKLHPLVNSLGNQYTIYKDLREKNRIFPGYNMNLKIPKEFKESISEILVLKEFNGKNASKKGVEQEAKVSSKLYFKAKPEIICERFIITDFMEGVALDILPSGASFNNWDFLDRIDFAWQWALQLDQLHNNTSRGDAVLHLDIKGPNMLLNYLENMTKGRVNVQLIDFDLSQSLNSNNIQLDINAKTITSSDQLRSVPCVGTEMYVSPEMMNGYKNFPNSCAGARTDIYSVAPLIWALFGATTPFLDKLNFRKCEQDIPNPISSMSKIPLNPQNLLSFKILPDWLNINCKLKSSVNRFLLRLGSQDYYTRPTTDEMLKFFTSFRNLSKIHEYSSETILNQYTEIKSMYEQDKQILENIISNLAYQRDPEFKILSINENISDYLDKLTDNTVYIFKNNNVWSFIETKNSKQNLIEPKLIQEEDMKTALSNIEKNTNPKLTTMLFYEAKRIFHDVEKRKYIEKHESTKCSVKKI